MNIFTRSLIVAAAFALTTVCAFAAGHRLVPSDTVQIKVVNQGDLDTQARVETDGTISRVGGTRDSAGNVVTIRRGAKVLRYDLKDLLAGKIDGNGIVLQNNDEVYVELAPVYFLYGYVARAGQYPMARRLTVQQALAAGGGISELGSESRIKIRRRDASGHIVESDVTLDDDVRPDDTVVVNERFF